MAARRAGAGSSVVDAVTVDDSGWRQMYFLVEIFYSTPFTLCGRRSICYKSKNQEAIFLDTNDGTQV